MCCNIFVFSEISVYCVGFTLLTRGSIVRACIFFLLTERFPNNLLAYRLEEWHSPAAVWRCAAEPRDEYRTPMAVGPLCLGKCHAL